MKPKKSLNPSGLFEYFEGDYGVRRLSAQVRDYYRIINRPLPNHKRIYRLMREMGLKFTKYSKRRRFMSNRKYQKMVCDITDLCYNI